MGVGDHIEIWVAVRKNADGSYSQALDYPAGSTGACRNTVFGGQEITVTDSQVQSFITEFDTNMYPKESAAFSALKGRPGADLQPTFGKPFNEVLGVPLTTGPAPPTRSSPSSTTSGTRTTTTRPRPTARPTSRASSPRCTPTRSTATS